MSASFPSFLPDQNQLNIPLALYIHVPWCVKKCPYCDFNSHAIGDHLTDELQQQYTDALIADFTAQLPFYHDRTIQSVFIGGGTPSLLAPRYYHQLFTALKQLAHFNPQAEITLEANPGTLEYAPFEEYLATGINRLSIGVQSFNDHHLQMLGRIHQADQAQQAIAKAQTAGFDAINVDLMHGLSQQTELEAIHDLKVAIESGVKHISWYQLTIEQNTEFFRNRPILPDENRLTAIQTEGELLLQQHGFNRYEVSAWGKGQQSQHNLNYWQFGDYLAIGAGAHGKISQQDHIYRYQKTRLPKDYLASIPAKNIQLKAIATTELAFEFMLNALRLEHGVENQLFSQRTGLDWQLIAPTIHQLQQRGLLIDSKQRLACTVLGKNYLNSVLEYFL